MSSTLITCDPKVMVGKPVVAGTRITVELILDKLAAGESFEQILNSYPQVTAKDIRAAVNYARAAVRKDWVQGAKRLGANDAGRKLYP